MSDYTTIVELSKIIGHEKITSTQGWVYRHKINKTVINGEKLYSKSHFLAKMKDLDGKVELLLARKARARRLYKQGYKIEHIVRDVDSTVPIVTGWTKNVNRTKPKSSEILTKNMEAFHLMAATKG